MPNDKCVICGKDTGVLHDTPVSERKRYVSGSGQLCRECYYDLYLNVESELDRIKIEEEDERLLEMSRKN